MSTTASLRLLENASATGDWFSYPGGWSIFTVVGNFTVPGNVSLEVLGPDGLTPFAITTAAANFRSSNTAAFGLAPGRYRASVTGGVVSVFAALERVPE